VYYNLLGYWAHVDPTVLGCNEALGDKGLGLLNARQDWFYSDKLWFTVTQTGPDYFVQYSPMYQPTMAINKELPVLQINHILLECKIKPILRMTKNIGS
jgi:hypothetical protein